MYINNKIYFQLFSKDTATAFFAKLCYNWKQSLGAGACADRRPSDGRRSARVARAIYPGGKHSSGGHVLTGKFCRPAIRVLRAEPKASAGPCLCPWQSRQSTTCASMCSLANWPATSRAELAGSAVLAIGYRVQASHKLCEYVPADKLTFGFACRQARYVRAFALWQTGPLTAHKAKSFCEPINRV